MHCLLTQQTGYFTLMKHLSTLKSSLSSVGNLSRNRCISPFQSEGHTMSLFSGQSATNTQDQSSISPVPPTSTTSSYFSSSYAAKYLICSCCKPSKHILYWTITRRTRPSLSRISSMRTNEKPATDSSWSFSRPTPATTTARRLSGRT